MQNLKLTRDQYRKALLWLSFWHILVIAISNYLVQFPFAIGFVDSTWGAFTFPFIFITTDLTVRIFGSSLARKIIFYVMAPALLISYVLSVLFSDGTWQGISSLLVANTFVARIALASFTAYVVGQLMDISVFNRLRQMRQWWVAPFAAAIFGNAVDTLVFFAVAFYQSQDAFMAVMWPKIALVDYGFKILICTIFFLPLYGVILSYLQKKLTHIDNQSSMEKSKPELKIHS